MTRMSMGMLTTLAILLCTPAPGAAQETRVPDKPELTVRITPPEPYVQEQIVQVVRLVAAHVFEEIVLDLPDVEGAEVITLQQPKTRKFKTYGAEGYIYETRRAIFAKASGELVVPAVRVSGSVALSRDERQSFALKSDPVVFDIKPPPADFSAPWWLVARRVKIEESWSTPIEELRVGDRVTRTIEATVTGATGAHLPELDQGRSTGLTVLPGQIQRSTEVTANEVIGKVSRSFDLRVDVDQPINISPVRLVWWNTDSEIEWRSAAPARRLEPLPRDVEGLVRTLMTEAEETHRTGRYGIMALVTSGVLGVIGSTVWLVMARQRRAPEDQVLLEAFRNKPDPTKAAKALLAWSETALPDDRPLSLERLGRQLGGDARDHLVDLQKATFGRERVHLDMKAVAGSVIAGARDRRRQSKAALKAKFAHLLLGPKRGLPDINGEA